MMVILIIKRKRRKRAESNVNIMIQTDNYNTKHDQIMSTSSSPKESTTIELSRVSSPKQTDGVVVTQFCDGQEANHIKISTMYSSNVAYNIYHYYSKKTSH